jgi:hypothetical protein
MTGNGRQLGDYFKAAVERLPQEMMRAEEDNARTALNTILRYSSGEISAAELRLLGHPYGIGRTPPQDPAIINVQTEEFVNSWHQDGPRVQQDGSITTVFENTSEHAKYLGAPEGTPTMQPRPLVPRVLEEIEPIITARRDEAFSRALEAGGIK